MFYFSYLYVTPFPNRAVQTFVNLGYVMSFCPLSLSLSLSLQGSAARGVAEEGGACWSNVAGTSGGGLCSGGPASG